METSSSTRQHGASLISLILLAAILASVGVVGAQLVPTIAEYRLIGKALDKIKAGASTDEMRAMFDKTAQVDDIKSISGKDLEISKNGNIVTIKFAYVKEIHLLGPAYLTMKYSGQTN